jgi:serine/threonine protein kinase
MEAILRDFADQELSADEGTRVLEALHGKKREEKTLARLPAAAAKSTASKCLRHTQRLKRDLIKAGLLDASGIKRDESGNKIRPVAPLVYSEMNMGRLLGTGGFSSVFELDSCSLHMDTETFESHEQEARKLLQESAVIHRDASAFPRRRKVLSTHDDDDDDERKQSKQTSTGGTTTRYAVKHLRRGLINDPEKFERAAIDMVLEAQLLLAIDHPNIIALRGWSYGGVKEYEHGLHTGFFIVLDRLTESLDERMSLWRTAFKKYSSRKMMPWAKQKNASKLEVLLEDRLKVLLEITSAMQYMHDRRIIYRDMKSSNVGFDLWGQLKIYDFGLSRLLPSRRSAMHDGYAMSRVGTKYYMAPEIRSKSPYNLSADIYSLGVLFWEVMSMSSPRETLQKMKKADLASAKRLMLPICECWPAHVRSIIEYCLSNDPHLRPSIGSVRMQLEGEVECFRPSSMGRPSFMESTATTTSLSNSSQTSIEFRSSLESIQSG